MAWQQPSDPIALGIVLVTGVIASTIDLRTRRVPNLLTASVTASGLALAALRADAVTFGMACAGCLAGLVLLLPGHFLGATGAGDVKLFAALGTLLGPKGIAFAWVYTALAGGVLAGVVAFSRASFSRTVERTATLVATGGANLADIERPTSNNRFAYAPAIAIGTLAVALGL